MAICLFAHSEGPTYQRIIAGVVQGAQDSVRQLVVYCSATRHAYNTLDESLVERMYSFRPDEFEGVIISFPDKPLMEYGESLHARGYPVVFIGRSGAVPHVMFENYTPLKQVAGSLVRAGHRRIAFLKGMQGASSVNRLKGYLDGLAENHLSPTPELLLNGNLDEECGYREVLAAWKKGIRFSALIAADDRSGHGALRALRELSISVPDEVEVVGFDDLEASKWSPPPLSSFAFPQLELGHMAVRQLTGCLNHEIELPVKFVRRASIKSTTRIDGEQPQDPPWKVSRTYAEQQLMVLARTPESARTLTQCRHAGRGDEQFLADFKGLLHACEPLEVDPACLSLVLEEKSHEPAGTSIDGESEAGLTWDHASSMLMAAIFEAQKKPAALASEFEVILQRLRELAFNTTEETVVIECLRQTLAKLGMRRAGLYYRQTTKDGQLSATHSVVRWDFDSRSESKLEQAGEGLELRGGDLLGQDQSSPGSFVAALWYGEEQMGLIALDLGCKYRKLYPDLIRQFALALQGARSSVLLSRASQDLIDASRMAGMAEIAVGVLHNVGNVLNSVNVSATVIANEVRHWKVESLAKLAALLRKHQDSLGEFLSNDPKGKLVLEFIESLAQRTAEDRHRALKEIAHLQENIDHIKEIVAMQQAYVSMGATAEPLDPALLMEDALRMNAGALLRHEVRVERQFQPVPAVLGVRAKGLQILVNLIRNAKYACDDSGLPDKLVTLRIERGLTDSVHLIVQDNGVGIPEENLTRIFSYGFTTRRDGHGFGLHTAANAATEMKGLLTAHSDGPGKGATFTLELPVASAACDSLDRQPQQEEAV